MSGRNDSNDVSFRLILWLGSTTSTDCTGCIAGSTTTGTGNTLRTMYAYAFAFAFVVAIEFLILFDLNSDLGDDCKRKETASGSDNVLYFSCDDDDGAVIVNGSMIAIATAVNVVTIRSKNIKDGLLVSHMCGTGKGFRTIGIEDSTEYSVVQSCYC